VAGETGTGWVTTGWSGPPVQAPPTVNTGSITTESIRVSWPRVALEEAYEVQRQVMGGGAWTGVGTTAPNTPRTPGLVAAIVAGDLASETTYCFRVRAKNPKGAGPWSNSGCATTKPDDSPPPPPPPAPKPDLSFAGSLILTPSFPDVGESFSLIWVGCNYGNAPTGPFTDVAQFDGGQTYRQSIPSIAPGACYQRTVTHAGVSDRNHYWYVYLDADGQVNERVENNNTNYYGFIVW
jgi:hypothetical protein